MSKEMDFPREEEEYDRIYEALKEAKAAFMNYLSKEKKMDTAYYDVEVTGYLCSTYDFKPYRKLEIKAEWRQKEEIKEGKSESSKRERG